MSPDFTVKIERRGAASGKPKGRDHLKVDIHWHMPFVEYIGDANRDPTSELHDIFKRQVPTKSDIKRHFTRRFVHVENVEVMPKVIQLQDDRPAVLKFHGWGESIDPVDPDLAGGSPASRFAELKANTEIASVIRGVIAVIGI